MILNPRVLVLPAGPRNRPQVPWIMLGECQESLKILNSGGGFVILPLRPVEVILKMGEVPRRPQRFKPVIKPKIFFEISFDYMKNILPRDLTPLKSLELRGKEKFLQVISETKKPLRFFLSGRGL